MIKVVAKITMGNSKKTCQFQTKINRKIDMNDLIRVNNFTVQALQLGYKVELYWKVTYDKPNYPCTYIENMNSKTLIIDDIRRERIFKHTIEQINILIK